MSTTPSIDQLKRAVSISEEIERLQEELASLLGAGVKISASVSAVPAAPKTRRGKRGLSAEGRARIAAAQKARWAKAKGDDSAPVAAAAKPGRKAKAKRNLSPEARERIRAAVKRRWAREKKAAK
jgi:hypothetical protein